MVTRKAGSERSVMAPDVDADELSAVEADFEGEFELDSVLVDGGAQPGVSGGGTITTAVLSRTDLSNATLRPLTLVNAVLRNVELSNASLQQVVARRIELHTCRAVGLRLSVEHASDMSIVDCRLDFAVLNIQKVKGAAIFRGCSFREATISGDLSNVSFQDCDFTDTEFRATRAAGCDLRTSRLTDARGLLSLRGATISAEQAISASLAIAREAGFTVSD